MTGKSTYLPIKRSFGEFLVTDATNQLGQSGGSVQQCSPSEIRTRIDYGQIRQGTRSIG